VWGQENEVVKWWGSFSPSIYVESSKTSTNLQCENAVALSLWNSLTLGRPRFGAWNSSYISRYTSSFIVIQEKHEGQNKVCLYRTRTLTWRLPLVASNGACGLLLLKSIMFCRLIFPDRRRVPMSLNTFVIVNNSSVFFKFWKKFLFKRTSQQKPIKLICIYLLETLSNNKRIRRILRTISCGILNCL
jgi:hypothetical protein